MHLPPDLKARLETYLESFPHAALAQAGEDISARYRRLDGLQSLQIRSAVEAASYLALRFPATWSAAHHVLRRVAQAAPEFSPRTILDIGAGPGTVTCAALKVFPSLKATMVEPNIHLRSCGEKIFDHPSYAAQDFSVFFRDTYEKERNDLVCAGYVLNEMPGDIEKIIGDFWTLTGDTLVLIEPGTPAGAANILRARASLISQGAHILSPCPHALACPLQNQTDRWCHFSVRVERSRLHKMLKKDASLPYEDEKYSYLVASRMPRGVKPHARILGHPQGAKLVRLELCRSDGTFAREDIPRSDPRHAAARRASWGDGL